MLRVKNLTVIYHGGKEPAVHQVNFALKRGSSLGLIGESGSGKTSIGLAIMGLLTKTAT
ncbi:MAG TPA: ABC transporter ATP-binding protein, partial [Firmicutes bacterium]|nr:ABC transporter ATP-binding protein [Bacillota bacterium]